MFPQRVNTTPRPYDDQADAAYAALPHVLLESAEIEFDRTAHWCYAHPTEGPRGGYYTLCGLFTPHNTRNRGNLLYCGPCNQRLLRLAGIALHAELHAPEDPV